MPNAAAPQGVNGDARADFDQLRDLLRLVASGEPPSREHAVSYLDCRSRLIASPSGDMLPGFLYQCGTIDRFREFIFLYDPDTELRCQFIDRMIGRARALSQPGARREPADGRAGSSAAWDF